MDYIGECKELLDLLRSCEHENLQAKHTKALSSLIKQCEWRETHLHLKSGGLYQEVARGIDATNDRPAEHREVVIYRAANGAWFCRGVREFDDGRFVPLPPSPGESK